MKIATMREHSIYMIHSSFVRLLSLSLNLGKKLSLMPNDDTTRTIYHTNITFNQPFPRLCVIYLDLVSFNSRIYFTFESEYSNYYTYIR